MTFLRDLFEKQLNEADTDPRLMQMSARGSHIAFNYVSLVLFPEVFISWIKTRKEGTTSREAGRVYQSVGKNISQRERDIFDEDIKQQIEREKEANPWEGEDNDYDETSDEEE